MAANISTFPNWSTTAGSNQPDSTDSAAIVEDLQKIQAEVRKYVATKGADIASATTTDLANATGNYVHITGTTTITGLGTVSAGVRFLLVFDGILTFTHNATSLILPTGANITTAAGDRCEVVSLGSGNFRCLWYQRASGTPLTCTTTQISDITSGTYTPTLTAGTNVDSVSTTQDFNYMRIGASVIVSGILSVDVTSASSATVFYSDIPVASDFDATADAIGTANTNTAAGYVFADVTNNRLQFSISSIATTSATSIAFIAQYIIK